MFNNPNHPGKIITLDQSLKKFINNIHFNIEDIQDEYSDAIKNFVEVATDSYSCNCKSSQWVSQNNIILLLNKQHLLIQRIITKFDVEFNKIKREIIHKQILEKVNEKLSLRLETYQSIIDKISLNLSPFISESSNKIHGLKLNDCSSMPPQSPMFPFNEDVFTFTFQKLIECGKSKLMEKTGQETNSAGPPPSAINLSLTEKGKPKEMSHKLDLENIIKQNEINGKIPTPRNSSKTEKGTKIIPKSTSTYSDYSKLTQVKNKNIKQNSGNSKLNASTASNKSHFINSVEASSRNGSKPVHCLKQQSGGKTPKLSNSQTTLNYLIGTDRSKVADKDNHSLKPNKTKSSNRLETNENLIQESLTQRSKKQIKQSDSRRTSKGPMLSLSLSIEKTAQTERKKNKSAKTLNEKSAPDLKKLGLTTQNFGKSINQSSTKNKSRTKETHDFSLEGLSQAISSKNTTRATNTMIGFGQMSKSSNESSQVFKTAIAKLESSQKNALISGLTITNITDNTKSTPKKTPKLAVNVNQTIKSNNSSVSPLNLQKMLNQHVNHMSFQYNSMLVNNSIDMCKKEDELRNNIKEMMDDDFLKYDDLSFSPLRKQNKESTSQYFPVRLDSLSQVIYSPICVQEENPIHHEEVDSKACDAICKIQPINEENHNQIPTSAVYVKSRINSNLNLKSSNNNKNMSRPKEGNYENSKKIKDLVNSNIEAEALAASPINSEGVNKNSDKIDSIKPSQVKIDNNAYSLISYSNNTMETQKASKNPNPIVQSPLNKENDAPEKKIDSFTKAEEILNKAYSKLKFAKYIQEPKILSPTSDYSGKQTINMSPTEKSIEKPRNFISYYQDRLKEITKN